MGGRAAPRRRTFTNAVRSVSLEQIPGLISFFQKDVPEAFKDVKDQALLAQFQAANQKVMDELKSYGQWMEKDLKPQAHGDFRIGADNYSKKLLYDEDVDIPLARLLEIGMANLRLNQRHSKKRQPNSIPTKRRERFWRSWKKIIRRQISFCRLSAIPWAG